MVTSLKAKSKKKGVKKKVVRSPKKKTSSKRAVKTKPKPAILKNAHPDKVFVLVNGQKLKNIKELADILDKLEDHVFDHHVTSDRNDFATWLRDVFQELELAREMAGLSKREHMQLVIYKHISHKLWQ